jgi:Ankyrin repeats (many copies)/Ankyrin repeat
MMPDSSVDAALLKLARAIAAGETDVVSFLLSEVPSLARASFAIGAARAGPKPFLLKPIGYYIYAGATALHVAAAAYRAEIIRELIGLGADVHVRNRRGAEPLHAAAVGNPASPVFDPQAQVAAIACLIAAGADPNATDASGVTPLHRAVRTRCAEAVRALLEHGADAGRTNDGGSTPLKLTRLTTGRGGSGPAAAKAQQQQILKLLAAHGAR